MKNFVTFVCLSAAFALAGFALKDTHLANAETQAPAPEIKIGHCAVTTVYVVFHGMYGDEPVNFGHGCRCSVQINGHELFPSNPMPKEFCEVEEKDNGQSTPK